MFNDTKYTKWYFNIMVVFIISGFWHGASWNFVIWGAIHGILQIIGIQINRWFPALVTANRRGIVKFLSQIWTFMLVTLAWVFFRIDSFSQIKLYFKSLFQHVNQPFIFHFNTMELIWSFLLIAYLFLIDKKIIKKPIGGFWTKLSIGLLVIYLFGVFQVKQFIYFQF